MMGISELPKYDSYKNSEIEWLGSIPAHWNLKSLKWVVKEHAGNGFPVELQGQGGDVPFLKVSDLSNAGVLVEGSANKVSYKVIKKKKWNLVPAGSLVTAKIGEALRKNHRKLLAHDSVIDNNCIAFECKAIETKYCFYLHSVIDFDWFVNPGAVPSISVRKYKSQKVAVPPLEEQALIAKFLDKKTTQIDEAVAIKEQQIGLLKERKKIIIQKAVTQGLDPNVPVKDSGVDWIGEIPAHWNMRPLTKEVFVQEGPGIMAVDFRDEGVPLIRISGVKGEEVSLDGCNYLSPSKVRSKWSHFKLNKGDLVISGSASTELIGEVGSDAESAILYTGLIRVTPQRKRLTKEYLMLFLGSSLFFTQIDLQKTGSTISHYGPSHLSNMFILMPGFDEQVKIVEFVKHEKAAIEKATNVQKVQIEKLKEYKATLINSAVTGKIRITPDMAEA